MAEEAKRRAEIARYKHQLFYFPLISDKDSFRILSCMNWQNLNILLLSHSCLHFDRLRELHTLKGHVESVVRLKGLDIETIQQAYTV